jgi:hypothetical protein
VPAIFLRRPEIGELAAVAGDPAPLSQVLRGERAAADPAETAQDRPPLGIGPVGLTPRPMLNMRGVDDPGGIPARSRKA